MYEKNRNKILMVDQERAAVLIAEAEHSVAEIAKIMDIATSTIYLWRQNPHFIERIEVLRAEMRQAVREYGIAMVENRIKASHKRWQKMQRLIDARAEEHKDVPGGDTGTLVRDVKSIGEGATVELYSFDAALMRELREIEKHAAEQLGQLEDEKPKTDGGGGNVLSEISQLLRKIRESDDKPSEPTA